MTDSEQLKVSGTDTLQRFMAYYQMWYTPEQLLSLKQPATRAALVLRGSEHACQSKPLTWYPTAWQLESGMAVDANASDYYVLNPASLLPILALDPQPGEAIADICAAPGGKSIAIAARMNFQGRLLASDLSGDRIKRVSYNFHRLQIPQASDTWNLQLLHASGNLLTQQFSGQFDKVLVDAPCSSEAHVLTDRKELKKWSSSKSSLLAKRQRKLIQSAIKLLRPGGRLVYSTCSISPLENQGVIEFMLKKFSGQLQYVPWISPVGKALELGLSVLPWETGMGPGYVCVLEKCSDF